MTIIASLVAAFVLTFSIMRARRYKLKCKSWEQTTSIITEYGIHVLAQERKVHPLEVTQEFLVGMRAYALFVANQKENDNAE